MTACFPSVTLFYKSNDGEAAKTRGNTAGGSSARAKVCPRIFFSAGHHLDSDWRVKRNTTTASLLIHT